MLNTLLFRPVFQKLQDLATTVRFAVTGVDSNTGDFGRTFFIGFRWNRVECGTGQNHAITLNHGKLLNLTFKAFAGAIHQNTFLLKWPQQVYQAAHIMNISNPYLLIMGIGNHGANAITSEQFLNQCAIIGIGNQVYTMYA